MRISMHWLRMALPFQKNALRLSGGCMSKLPVISGRECIKALENAGYYFKEARREPYCDEER